MVASSVRDVAQPFANMIFQMKYYTQFLFSSSSVAAHTQIYAQTKSFAISIIIVAVVVGVAIAYLTMINDGGIEWMLAIYNIEYNNIEFAKCSN